ncbi:MMPL family transporter [Micromonospora chersina]|uniref:MMPL family transporter n=1 Tax=Micromonospora chersina TaxID=47854 RepID=UPI0033E67915
MPIAGLGSKISEVQVNESTAFLPSSAESTQVDKQLEGFSSKKSTTAVILYIRPEGLTEADKATIGSDVKAFRSRLGGKLAAPPMGPIESADRQAAQVLVEFSGTDPLKFQSDIEWVREQAQSHPGLTAHVTGPAGVFADLFLVFQSINGVLLLVAAVLVLLILFVVYRSPLLPLLVLFSGVIGLSVSNGLVYLLARADLTTLTGQTQGILDILVLGAGTDYAILLVSRYREELRRETDKYVAMRSAWRASVAPILASAGTVVLGLLCLLVSDLGSNRGLGPVAAVGIGCALLAMLGLLPAILTLTGRACFWPFRPAYGSAPVQEKGLWARIARLVGRRARIVWALSAVVLAVCALGMSRLEADGIPATESFVTTTDSQTGQSAMGRHFPAGTGSPTFVTTRAERTAEVTAAVKSVRGVADAAPFTDLPPGTAGEPKVVNGLTRVDVTLADTPDSEAANETIRSLRRELAEVDGADAKVGGYTAVLLDLHDTSKRDRKVIIPLVLLVVFLVLVVLLRAVVAPLLLIASVVLSFAATMGVCALVFEDVFGFAGADSGFPLQAFIFLVALGIDYNIFLMTRVREEVGLRGHRAGTLTGLAVTGGVITSAGLVLAATFAALAVLPLVNLAELAFAVAFGVLLDTLIVRSLLIPALTIDFGPAVWWPSRTGRDTERAVDDSTPASTDSVAPAVPSRS